MHLTVNVSVPILEIALLIFVLALLSATLMWAYGLHVSRNQLMVVLLVAAGLTVLSLLVKGDFYSGTYIVTQAGWPHAFYSSAQPASDGTAIAGHLVPGPVGAYIIIDILFYGFICLVAVVLYNWRKQR